MTLLRYGHASLQFSDNPEQKAHDVRVIFSRGYDILTGTESGEQPLYGLVRREARRQGYMVHSWRECWIAVKKSNRKRGSWRKGSVWVVSRTKMRQTRGHDRGFPWVSFEHPTLGRIAVAAGHYPTKGRRPGDPNHWINRLYATKIGRWAKRMGKGPALAFYSGDQNMLDRVTDTFFGEPLTSVWDELEKWPSTGHGNIDVIASYDRDGRVKAKSARALPDRKVFLHTDHFLIEATFDIEPARP